MSVGADTFAAREHIVAGDWDEFLAPLMLAIRARMKAVDYPKEKTKVGSDLAAQRAAADALTKGVAQYVELGEGETVTCPRAKSDFTPCVARDGGNAVADDGTCVGCWAAPLELLRELREKVGGRE